MQYLFYFILIFVLIIGISDIIHNAKLSLFKTKNSKRNTLICYLSDDSAEFCLHYAIEQQTWYGPNFISKIIAINNIKSAEILNQCEVIAKTYNIDIIIPEEFTLEKIYGEING